MTQDLSGIFNALVGDTLEKFPWMRGYFAVATVSGRVYGTLDRRRLNRIARDEDLARLIESQCALSMKRRSSIASTKSGAQLVIFNDETRQAAHFTPQGGETVLGAKFILYHELGHLICPKAMYGTITPEEEKNNSECIADAYAVIRMYQDYGPDCTLPPHVADQRENDFIRWGHLTHYTSPVVDRIMHLAQNIDLAKLTALESLNLASDTAAGFRPDFKKASDLWKESCATDDNDTTHAIHEALLNLRTRCSKPRP